eukprot:15332676-Ditylum_brightwellii.AAC.1
MTATQTDKFPSHAYKLATLPRSHNGIGLFTPTKTALLAFVIPFIHAIRYATKGLKLHQGTVSLSPFLMCVFANWEHSSLPLFAKFRSHLHSLVKSFPLPQGYMEQDRLRFYVYERSPETLHRLQTSLFFGQDTTLPTDIKLEECDDSDEETDNELDFM